MTVPNAHSNRPVFSRQLSTLISIDSSHLTNTHNQQCIPLVIYPKYGLDGYCRCSRDIFSLSAHRMGKSKALAVSGCILIDIGTAVLTLLPSPFPSSIQEYPRAFSRKSDQSLWRHTSYKETRPFGKLRKPCQVRPCGTVRSK